MALPSLQRTDLGTNTVLALDEAAAWLPLEQTVAEAWLRRVGVVRLIGLGREQAEVVIWGEVIEAIRNDVRERLPLTTWRAIAAAVGISEDTLARKRAAAKDHTQPWFADAEAVREWYAGLLAPKEPARKKKRAAKAVAGGAVDWNAVARGR